MPRSFRSTRSYVQGPGVRHDLGAELATVPGSRLLLMGGSTALAAVEDDLVRAFTDAGRSIVHVERGVSACTLDRIERGERLVASHDADTVVGVGGGSAIDAAKAVAARSGRGLVSVPTLASTDAAASAIAVVSDDTGAVVEAVVRDHNPELVVVDTEVIANAPARFLRHGIGDALATKFEAEATARADGNTLYGGEPTRAGLAAARACHDELDTRGRAALGAVGRGEVTGDVERVVEAIVLLSGIGFENGGLAGAHALESACRTAGTTAPHGVVVAFCLLVQLELEDHDAIDHVHRMIREFGLAASLRELGLESTVDEIARGACDHPLMANEPVTVAPEAVRDAIETVDAMVTASGDRSAEDG